MPPSVAVLLAPEISPRNDWYVACRSASSLPLMPMWALTQLMPVSSDRVSRLRRAVLMSCSIRGRGAAPLLRLMTDAFAAMLSVRTRSMSSSVCNASSTPRLSLSATVVMGPRYPPVVVSFLSPPLLSSLWHAKELWLSLPHPSL